MQDFDQFIRELKNRLEQALPGKEAQMRMGSPHRKEGFPVFPEAKNPRYSGVLIILYPEYGNIRTILIQRPDYEGVHSGQISFPGGKKEDIDKDLTETALREAHEEIGINTCELEILGRLTELFIAPSNFIVQPVVAFTRTKPNLIADPVEVTSILEIDLAEFFKPENLQEREIDVRGWKLEVPCYYIDNRVIWGATAMIISELLQVLPAFHGRTDQATSML